MQNYDVLLLIALTEEMETFSKYGFFKLEAKQNVGPFLFYEFTFYDKHKKKRRGALLVANEMGSKMRDAAISFCKRFRTTLAINAGISGRLNSDARIGDVVLANEINLYAERSAAVQQGVSYTLQAGGSAISIDRTLRNSVSETSFSQSVGFPSFINFCTKYSFDISAEHAKKCEQWIEEGNVAGNPRIVVGNFACGSIVGKAEAFQDFLRSTNKNLIAIDMESGFAGDAILNLEEDEQPKFLSIRAISDPGNQDKKTFDSVGHGAFRQWAMHNIVVLIKKYLSHEADFQDHQTIVQVNNPLEQNGVEASSQYTEVYPGQSIDPSTSTELRNMRYSNLRKESEGLTKFSNYQQFLSELLSANPGARFLVEGSGGCGKSSMLRFAEIEINQSEDCHRAVYINSRKLFEKLPVDQVDEAIGSILLDLIGPTLREDESLIVLLDELFGHKREEALVSGMLNLANARKGKVLLAFGLDHYETSKTSANSPDGLYLFKIKYDAEFKLKNTNIVDDTKAIPLISGLLATGHNEIRNLNAKDVLRMIRDLGFPYINAFVISLVLDNRGKKLYRDCRSSTDFILHAMRDELNLRQKSSSENVTFTDVCIESLRTHTPELSKQRISPKRLKIQNYYDENFAQFPKLVQTCLIANAVAELMKYPPEGSRQLFDTYEIKSAHFYSIVFGCDVTACIKDLLHDADLEERLLKSALSICDNIEGPSLSFALYLAGRAVSANGKLIAKDIFKLTSFLVDDQSKFPKIDDIRSISEVSQDDKFLRLAIRTHFISAAYSEDLGRTTEYIGRVLSDPVEESLNRTFHLEYYGDHPLNTSGSASISVRLDLDESATGWKRTRGVLYHRISKAIATHSFSQIQRIHVLTYFCIVKAKHEIGGLDSSEKQEAQELLSSLKTFSFEIGDQLSDFLKVISFALKFDRFDILDVITHLYQIKLLPRFGWIHRSFGLNDNSVETVGSHILGAMLLADILLPDLYPHLNESEISKIKDLILSHDIGEAFVGDYHPSDNDKRDEERGAISLLHAMSIYGNFSNIRHYKGRFNDFSKATSHESKIANSLDKLDSIIQAYIYLDKFRSHDELKRFMSENLDRIIDPKLKKFAQEVIARAQSRKFEKNSDS